MLWRTWHHDLATRRPGHQGFAEVVGWRLRSPDRDSYGGSVTAPGIPLPTDDELSADAMKVLSALPPLNIFRALAALPLSLRPFLELGGSILGGANLTPSERELAILRVAHLTSAGYERQQHEQLGRSVGLTAAEIDATTAPSPGELLTEDGALICRATDEITRDIRLSDETLASVRERWRSEE